MTKIHVGAYVFGFFQLSGTLDLSTDVPRDPAAAVQRVAATRETEALTLVAAPEAASNVATASATDLSARETTYEIRGLQKNAPISNFRRSYAELAKLNSSEAHECRL